MEIRVLRYFLTLVREGSITRAAEVLHMTQPTLSRQLAQMEEELGVRLFERGKNVSLTDEGMLLRRRAQEIIELADRTQHDFDLRNQGLTGEISIGSAETYAARTLAQLIASFHLDFPYVRFQLHSGNADLIKDRIDKDLDDFGLFLEPVDISKYDYIRLKQSDKWGLLMRADDSIANEEVISRDIFKTLPLIMTERFALKSRVASWMDDDLFKLNIISTYNMIANAALLVETGVGYAVTIEGSVELYDRSRFRFLPLDPVLESRTVLAWKKYQKFGKASSKFLEYIYESEEYIT